MFYWEIPWCCFVINYHIISWFLNNKLLGVSTICFHFPFYYKFLFFLYWMEARGYKISSYKFTFLSLQEFLGLKRVITEKHFYFNSTKGFPCLLKSESRSTPHCLGKTKGRSHPYIDPRILERLRDFYRPFNEKFYQMAGMNFGWPWNVVILNFCCIRIEEKY